jgi:hypothetical protein
LIEGGDPLENCREPDILFIPNDCICLVSALHNAPSLFYHKRTASNAVRWPATHEDPCKIDGRNSGNEIKFHILELPK